MRKTAILILALLLATAVLSPALAQGQGQSKRQGPDGRANAERAVHEREAAEWNNVSADARARGLARAEAARLFSGFAYTGGNATGRFVSFGLDNGTLANYTLRDNATTFFASVTPSSFGGNGTPRVHGATLRLAGANVTFSAHNNPTGMFAYRAGNASLTLTLALGPNVTAAQDSNRTLTLNTGGMHGHLVVQGNGTYNATGGTVTVALEPGAGLLFLGHPSQTPLASNLHAVRDAMANDRVGGILNLVATDGAPLQDRVFLGVEMRATKAGQGRAEVIVSSDEPAGKAVVLNLDNATLNLTAGRNVTVTLDGQRVLPATSAAAALNASQASYHANASAGGVQVIVNVPGFSDHTIVVQSDAPTTATPTGPTLATPTSVVVTPTSASPTPAAGTPPASPTATSPAPTPADTPAPGLALVVVALACLALLRRR